MKKEKKTTPYTLQDFSKVSKQKINWKMVEPKKQERIQLYKKNPKCILIPPTQKDDKKDSSNYKFPICPKNKTQPNCDAILAASRRARLAKYPDVLKLTTDLIKKWQCTKKATIEANEPIIGFYAYNSNDLKLSDLKKEFSNFKEFKEAVLKADGLTSQTKKIIKGNGYMTLISNLQKIKSTDPSGFRISGKNSRFYLFSL
jgi:hypothetical protein